MATARPARGGSMMPRHWGRRSRGVATHGAAPLGRFVAVALFFLALAPSAWYAWTLREMAHLGIRHDDSLYWVSARSLAEGRGYRILNLPDQPYQTKYPPLYPWLLSWVWRIRPAFPDNLPLAMLVAWLALPAFLLLARCTFVRLGLGWGLSWALVIVLAVSADVMESSVTLMTELVFSSLLMAAFLAAERAAEDSSKRMALAAGALAAAAYLTRVAALPLLIVAPLWLLARRRRAAAVIFFLAMLPAVTAWTLWVGTHLTPQTDPVWLYYTSYAGYYRLYFSWHDLPSLVWQNADGILRGVGALFVYGVSDSFWGTNFWRLLAAVSIWGAVRQAQHAGASLYHWFAAAHVLLLLVWHWYPGDRFERHLLPLFPLLMAGLASALRDVGEWLWATARAPVLGRVLLGSLLSAGLAAVLFQAAVTAVAALIQFPNPYTAARQKWDHDRALYRWMAEHLPPDAHVLAIDDVVVFLYSGRRSVTFRLDPMLLYRRDRQAVLASIHSMRDYARSRNLSYIVCTRSRAEGSAERRHDFSREAAVGEVYRSLGGVLERDPLLHLVHQSGDTLIYRTL